MTRPRPVWPVPKPRGVHLWVILLILLLMVIAGTVYAVTRGDDDGPAADSVVVVVENEEKAETVTTQLDCDGIDTARLCDKLTDELLAPVPADQACTMIYGGPETATITGTLRGKKVKASFSRSNGCEIDRWDQLVTALKPAGIKGLA